MLLAIRHFLTHSIRRQLVLGIALVHAVLMTIFVVDLVDRERQFLLSLSKAQALGLAETLAANGSSWIISHDIIGIEEVINSQSGFPGLQYAIFSDLRGKVLGYSDRSKVGMYISDRVSQTLINQNATPQVLVDNSNIIDVAAPVMSGNQLVGWARVGISRSSISSNLNVVTRSGLLYTLLAIIIGTVFAWIMARGLTSGIKHITGQMRLVKQGNREVDFSLDRKDEIGILSKDITQTMNNLNALDKELHDLYERTRVTLRSIGDGVITTHADGMVDYLNPVAEALTGWTAKEAKGQNMEKIFPITNELSGEKVPNPVEKVLTEKKIIGLSNHTILTHRNGQKISIEDSAAPIYDDNENIIGVVLVFHDATEERLLTEQMKHQASHDSLTGIWNRRAFERKLLELQVEAQQNHSMHMLLYIDLDQFKIINDTSGHIAGDELLRQVSQHFSDIIRGSDMLARLGGDEFGVLLPHCDEIHAKKVAENIRSTVENFSFVWEKQQYKIGTSIGIAVISQFSQCKQVLSHADLACYSAKDKGRNQVHIYTENDQDLIARHGEMHWVSKINKALKNNQFILYSQMIAPIGTQGHKQYHEVLVRMLGDDGDIILPNSFIPAAERYDLMPQIDWFVINKAYDWLSQQVPDKYRLSINLSGNSLGNKALLDDIEKKFSQSPQLAKNICLEITETSAISNLRVALNFMQRLIKIGVKFSLDDFGSGLSSFSYLKNMPVSSLKIDGSFVRDMVNDSVDAAMVQAISQISRKLDITTIAEFVEDEAILQMLKDYGVDYAQGYHIEKPHPLTDL